MMFLMTGLLISLEPLLLIGFLLLVFIIVAVSQIPFSLVLRNLRPFVLLFFITVLIHIIWTAGEVIYRVPIFGLEISREGIRLGLIYSFRLALLILIAAIMTLATSPIELTDALERLISPLKRLKVPTHEIVMMLTLSLRFIPTLMEEAQRIKNAQVSRGAIYSGSILNRLKGVIPLILPLFVSAFRRADELAWAMDSRCYIGGKDRTSYKELRFRTVDYLVLTFSVVLVVASFLI
jgi:energy-coupling factor transport system permease protein